jgi:hypothetical protein
VINLKEHGTTGPMKRLRIIRRWFTRKFGFARVLCLLMLAGFVALRVLDPAPIRELRLRTFDIFQLLDPRVPCSASGHGRAPRSRT